MNAYSRLLFDMNGSVARVTLNRPDAANALDFEMARELSDVSRRCEEHSNIRAVILTGAGKMFCGGGDLKAFAAQSSASLSEYIEGTAKYMHHAVIRFARMRAPLIAAVNGPAGGAGMSLALAADFTMVAESVKMTLGYSRAGLTPDGSSTYFLPRLVGPKRALELAVTSRVLSAREALELGLVTRVIADDRLMAEAEALAAELANGPTNAYGGIKRLLLMSGTNTLEEQLDYESSTVARMARTHDGPEGISAFVQKRAPRFSGE